MTQRTFPPCTRDCPDRIPGCHGSCEKYKTWKAEIEARNQAIKQSRGPDVTTAASKSRNRRCQQIEQKKARGNKR